VKSLQDLREYFAVRKAEGAGGLTPTKDDNEVGRKIGRKDGAISWEFDYKWFYCRQSLRGNANRVSPLEPIQDLFADGG